MRRRAKMVPGRTGQTAPALVGVVAGLTGAVWGAAPVKESEAVQPRQAVVVEAPAREVAPPVEPASTADSGINALYYQLQVLQDDVRRLQGVVEEQHYRIERLTREQRERYIELDQRLVAIGHAPDEAPNTGAAAGPALPKTEREAYNAAYALFRQAAGQSTPERKEGSLQALARFTELIETYPAGDFTPNAFYWSGEIHLYMDELELARQAFVQVVNLFSDHGKVPDALYKLGVVYHRLGDNDSALRYLDRVLAEYADHAAARLARSYAAETALTSAHIQTARAQTQESNMRFGDFKNTEAFNPTFKRVRELGLEQHILELDSYGFTVVPPERVAERAFLERIRGTVLRICKERTGVHFDLDCNGSFGNYKAQPQTDGQFLLFYLLMADRVFEEWVLNPTLYTLIDYLMRRPAADFQPDLVREVEGQPRVLRVAQRLPAGPRWPPAGLLGRGQRRLLPYRLHVAERRHRHGAGQPHLVSPATPRRRRRLRGAGGGRSGFARPSGTATPGTAPSRRRPTACG